MKGESAGRFVNDLSFLLCALCVFVVHLTLLGVFAAWRKMGFLSADGADQRRVPLALPVSLVIEGLREVLESSFPTL